MPSASVSLSAQEEHALPAEFGMSKSCLWIRLPKSFSWVNLFFILTRSLACVAAADPLAARSHCLSLSLSHSLSLTHSHTHTHTHTLRVWLSMSSSWQRNYRHFVVVVAVAAVAAVSVAVAVGVTSADASASLTAIE